MLGDPSWSALAYSDYITGLDALLAAEITATTVTKTDIGVSSDVTKDLYSYHYEAPNRALHLLLVAGQHGMEHLGMYGAMRWFEQFVQSSNPLMVALRDVLSVSFVPVANPGRYGTSANPRPNLNDVDLNRNWDYRWAEYTQTAADTGKGPSPMSEPEVQAIAALVEADTFAIDCHNFGGVGLPWMQLLRSPDGSASPGDVAVASWVENYADQITDDAHDDGTINLPYLISWLAAETGQPSYVLEMSSEACDSIAVIGSRYYATRRAVQRYAGFITELCRAQLGI